MGRISIPKLFVVAAALLIIASVGFGFAIWETSEPEDDKDPIRGIESVSKNFKIDFSSPSPPRRFDPPEIDTFSWKIYRNEELGFEINLPERWTPVHVYPNLVGFGGPDYGVTSGDFWGDVWLISDLNAPIARSGGQFSRRVIMVEEITLNGSNALLVTVTTPEFPDWRSSAVYVGGNTSFYAIGGDIEDETFRAILGSFKLVP